MKKHVLLILSSAPCDPELQFLFGAIPASAVPVGGSTLLSLQLEQAEVNGFNRVYVTYPEDVDTPVLNREVRFIRKGRLQYPKDLMDVLAHALATMEKEIDPDIWGETLIHVLWGDTLVTTWAKDAALGMTRSPNLGSSRHWQYLTDSSVFNGYFALDFKRLSQMINGPSHGLGSRAFDDDSPRQTIHDLVDRLSRMFVGEDERKHWQCEGEHWFDFGHLSTYFKSKRQFMARATRHFNGLTVGLRTVVKTGPYQKIYAEFRWFTDLPQKLKLYVPRMTTSAFAGSYEMEYLPMPTLAELFVHGRLEQYQWERILDEVLDWVDMAARASREMYLNEKREVQAFEHLVVGKAVDRLNALGGSKLPETLGPTFMVDMKNAISVCTDSIDLHKTGHYLSIVHGDLCFSNILYDSRVDNIQIIDPRGLNGLGDPSIFGDLRYELAKVFHSLVGYDHVMAGREVTVNQYLIDYFLSEAHQKFEIEPREIYALTALLFFTMLPLHSEDLTRQVRLAHLGMDVFNTMEERWTATTAK